MDAIPRSARREMVPGQSRTQRLRLPVLSTSKAPSIGASNAAALLIEERRPMVAAVSRLERPCK